MGNFPPNTGKDTRSGKCSMRILTHVEQQFFRHTTMKQVQERNIHRKSQWIRKAQSILNTFESKHQHNKSGDIQTLFQAMGIQSEIKDNNRKILRISKIKTNTKQKTNKNKTNIKT